MGLFDIFPLSKVLLVGSDMSGQSPCRQAVLQDVEGPCPATLVLYMCFDAITLAALTATKPVWHAGELFFIGYQMDKKPACVWYAGLDKAGALQFDVRVDLPVSPSSAHAVWLHHYIIGAS